MAKNVLRSIKIEVMTDPGTITQIICFSDVIFPFMIALKNNTLKLSCSLMKVDSR